MIVEKNDNLYDIRRIIHRGEKYDTENIHSVIIEKYDAIDVSSFSCTIFVNASLSYQLTCRDVKVYLKTMLTSEFRDQKIKEILS
jgi:hypothetical protein